MSEPSISAVIPVHNGERYLADAISSVLAQTHQVRECLVIDDGSTDTTPEVAARFNAPVRYVAQPRSGVSAARNHGAELATGELVAFLDHDDTWLPKKLELQTEALAREQATLALCAVRVVDADGRAVRVQRLRARDDLLTSMLTFDGSATVSCSSTGLVLRAGFLQMEGFDPALSMSADWDLLIRNLLRGTVAYVDEPLVRYRVHGANMSRDISAMERDMRTAFAKVFRDPMLPELLRRRRRHAYAGLYRMLAGSYRDAGRWSDMLRTGATALRYDPAVALRPRAPTLDSETYS
jgi:glycosyltransferase involved in cell wall biosynthesis